MSELNGMALAADAAAALLAGATKDQIAAKMLNSAVLLSIEEIGMVNTIDGLLAVLKCLAEECPREFEAVRFIHANPAEQKLWSRA